MVEHIYFRVNYATTGCFHSDCDRVLLNSGLCLNKINKQGMRRIKFELKGLRVLKNLQKPLEAKIGGKFPPLITLDGSDKGKKQRHVKLSSDRNYQ